MQLIILTVIGVCSGVLGGLFGVGGAILIIPALVFLLGYNQHLAQGTSIAVLVLPIGILGAIEYFKKGYVDMKAIPFIALGFLVGALIGAKLGLSISDVRLKQLFGFFLLIVAVKMIYGK